MAFLGLLRRNRHERAGFTLYGAAVAAARDPYFYSRLGVPDTRKVDDDMVRSLLPDLGLADAELVDAAAHDLDGAVEVFRGERLVRWRDRLQRDLEAALQVEPERRLLVDRRARDREQRHGDERRDEEENDVDG